jgi:hypothetical protein
MSRSSFRRSHHFPGDAKHARGPSAEFAFACRDRAGAAARSGCLRSIPLDPLRERLNRSLSSAIGRPLRIEADVRIEHDFDAVVRFDGREEPGS